jgi:hypothetical protein
VNFKYETSGQYGPKWGPAHNVGEVEIRLRDGDTVAFVLDMAVAMADYGPKSEGIVVGNNHDRLGEAFRELSRRQQPEPGGGTMKP